MRWPSRANGSTIARASASNALAEYGIDADAPVTRHWMELVATLHGFPRHLSQHSGGFVIARDKLSRMVPIETAAMKIPGEWSERLHGDRPESERWWRSALRRVIQWDKDDLESLGLLKVDVLALGMLTALRRSLDFINAWHRHVAGELQRHPSRGRGHLRDDLPRRHGGRVPDRKPRSDEHAAAAAAAQALRPGDRGRDRAAGADPGRHGASVPEAPAGAGTLRCRRSPSSTPRSNARWACRSSRSR